MLFIPDYSRVWGIDISHWNQLTDLQTAKANGCKFVIIKGCDGAVSTRYFTENKERAKAAGLPWGMYAWLYPDRYVSITSQVAAWWARVRDDYPPLGVWIDAEWTTYGGVPAHPVTADLEAALSRWQTVTGRQAGVYTARGYSNSYLQGFNWQSCQLWVANYGVTSPALPIGATTWKFWQFTDSLDGEIAPSATNGLDGNYYNGTINQFNSEFGQTEPGDTMAQYRVRNNITLRVRYAPPTVDGILGADAGKVMVAGDKFDSDQTSSLSGVPWLRITRIIKADDGRELFPPLDKSWWCNGSGIYVELITVTPPPPPPPPPAPVTLKSANMNLDPATSKVKTTYTYSDGTTKVLDS